MIWVFAFVFVSMNRGCRVWHNISHIPCTWKKIVHRLFSGIVDDDDDEMTRWTRQHTLRHISLNNFTLQKLYPHTRRHGKICEMGQKKTKILAYLFFLRYNISLFSYSFVAFRFVSVILYAITIFRLRWWRITLTNQIYIQKPIFSFSHGSIAAGP